MMSPLLYIVVTIILLILIRKYRERQWGWCKNKESLEGKVVIITGANNGIGFETAKDLARRKATIIFACRDVRSAQRAVDKIKKTVPDCREMVTVHLDLADIQNIKLCVKEITQRFHKIDILINNAGVYFPLYYDLQSYDRNEIHFSIHHLGPFLFTNLLLENIKNATPARIINVTSIFHEKGIIDLEDLNMRKFINDNINYYKIPILKNFLVNPAYANSKLANVYFGRELAKKLKGTGIDVYNVCPGYSYTGLFKYATNFLIDMAVIPASYWYLSSSRQGAQSVIYCATEPSLKGQSGNFYKNCKLYTPKINYDENVSRKLWTISSKLVELS